MSCGTCPESGQIPAQTSAMSGGQVMLGWAVDVEQWFQQRQAQGQRPAIVPRVQPIVFTPEPATEPAPAAPPDLGSAGPASATPASSADPYTPAVATMQSLTGHTFRIEPPGLSSNQVRILPAAGRSELTAEEVKVLRQIAFAGRQLPLGLIRWNRRYQEAYVHDHDWPQWLQVLDQLRKRQDWEATLRPGARVQAYIAPPRAHSVWTAAATVVRVNKRTISVRIEQDLYAGSQFYTAGTGLDVPKTLSGQGNPLSRVEPLSSLP